MRLVPLAALFALAAPLAAQTPDPAAFYPLGVGDVREYYTSGDVRPPEHTREQVVGDTVVSGQSYRLVVTTQYDQNGAPIQTTRSALRFDTLTATIVVGAGFAIVPPCPFGVVSPECPFGTAIVPDVYTIGGLITTVQSFGGPFGSQEYAAGLGLYRWFFEASERVQRLRFARIGGVAYGSPYPLLPPMAPEPSAYWPLEAGNVWVLRIDEVDQNASHFHLRRVTGSSTVSDTTYAVVATCSAPLDGGPFSCLPMPQRLRVDARTGEVRQRIGNADLPLMCGLLPTAASGPITCSGEAATLAVSGPTSVQIGASTVPVASVRTVELPDGARRVAAGIGPLGDSTSSSQGTLVYARIGGVEYGVNPVAAATAPSSARLALRAGPNPTAGPLAVTVTRPAPGALTLDVFDALGRRVHTEAREAPAGETRLDVDASRWAPGVYVVRVGTGEAAATVRVVRR